MRHVHVGEQTAIHPRHTYPRRRRHLLVGGMAQTRRNRPQETPSFEVVGRQICRDEEMRVCSGRFSLIP